MDEADGITGAATEGGGAGVAASLGFEDAVSAADVCLCDEAEDACAAQNTAGEERTATIKAVVAMRMEYVCTLSLAETAE
jgi:hypothetical protein